MTEEDTQEWYLEEIGPAFAALLTAAAVQHGAGIFAADLAAAGANPEKIRDLAEAWKNWAFEPPEFAGELLAFADRLGVAHA